MNNRSLINEVTRSIKVSHIFPYCEPYDLASTSLVCKKFRDDTREYLFRIREIDRKYREKKEKIRLAESEQVQVNEEYHLRKERDIQWEITILDQRIKLLDKFLRQITVERKRKFWLSGRIYNPYRFAFWLAYCAAYIAMLALLTIIAVPLGPVYVCLNIFALSLAAVMYAVSIIVLFFEPANAQLSGINIRSGIERFDNYSLSLFSSQVVNGAQNIKRNHLMLNPNHQFSTINKNTTTVRQVCGLMEVERRELLIRKTKAQLMLAEIAPSASPSAQFKS